MPSKPKRPRDPNQLAKSVVELATGEANETTTLPKNQGRSEGGRKGGKSRAASLSVARRREIARKGAVARWSKPKR